MIYYFLHFAITLWPFLNFYASKANHQLASLSDLSLLFIVFWSLGLLFCQIIKRISKFEKERILIFYTICIIWFFSFSIFWNFVNNNFSTRYSAAIYLFILGILISAFYKPSKLHSVQKAIQVFIIVIFSFSLLENFYISITKRRDTFLSLNNEDISFKFKQKPNIYFLLLDAYPRADALKSFLNYDNSNFVNFFRGKGFIVAEKSYSNYPNTDTSLSATFNMDYLKEGNFNRSDILSPDKKVLSILKENNYKFIILPAWYDFLSAKNSADICISNRLFNYFSTTNFHLAEKTILALLVKKISFMLYVSMDEIKKIFHLEINNPKFIFIHYLHFHDFVFNKNCKIVGSEYLPQNLTTRSTHETNLTCMNGFIIDSINEIRRHDPQSIIIVQGDHGPWFWREGYDTPTSPSEFEKIFSIFSAVYIPGLDKNSAFAKYLASSPSPVNDFRIIFSYLSNMPYEILPDKHFNSKFKEFRSGSLPNEIQATSSQ